MKQEKREKLKKQIIERKLQGNIPNEFVNEKTDTSFAKFKATMMPVDTGLGALCLARGIIDLVFFGPIGLCVAIPFWGLSALCVSLVAKHIKLLKDFGKKYGLSFKDTVKSLFDKEVFEVMATNSIDLQKKNKENEPEEHYEPKQPINSLTDEELLGKQTTTETDKSNKEQTKTTKQETKVQEEIEKER